LAYYPFGLRLILGKPTADEESLELEDPICHGDDFWGMPRVVLSADWRPRNLHGARTRRPAPPEGPAAPAAG
jgi:cytochrome c5